MAEKAPGTYWARENPNHVSFFPKWTDEEGSIKIAKLVTPEQMFFSKYDLSLYMHRLVTVNAKGEQRDRFTSFMYYSPAPGKCILIEGTGGVARRRGDDDKLHDSFTACNTNLKQCAVNNMFTQFKANTISDGVEQLNKVWDLIQRALEHGPNKKEIIRTITLAAENYHPEYFVVGKRLGDESQALACLRDLKIVTYGKDKETQETIPEEQKGMPYVNVFVTFDRLALAAALYYRVPAVIFSWDLKTTDPKTNVVGDSSRISGKGGKGGAFIAYRSELDTPEAQYNSLMARITETLSDAPPAEPDANVLQELTDIYAVMEKIDGKIADAKGEINKWIKLDPRFHHQTTASGGSLSEAYKMLLGLMIYVPGIQQFSLARRLHSQIRDLGEVREEMLPMMRPILNSKTKNPPAKVTGEELEELVNNVQKFYDTEITYRNTIKKYNASKEGINNQAAAADFSHISLKGPHRRREWKKGKKIVRGGEGLDEITDKDARGIANRADGAIAALEAIDDDTVTELKERITQNPLLSLPEILTGRTILLSILEALQLLPDKNALSKDFLNTIVDVLHAFWVAASKKFSNKLLRGGKTKSARKPPAASRWIKGEGSPPSGGLIDFISKGLPRAREGSLSAALNNIETKAAADAPPQRQSEIHKWSQSGGRRVKRKRKQTGGANGNRFLEYDCKIKTFVALYLVATYTEPPPSVSPDAATYPQEKGILIPLRDGGYGYASSVNFDPKLVGKAMDYCEKIQFETVKASEAAAKDDDDGAVVDGGDAGGAPREEEGGIIYNHIAHQYNEVWGDDATDTNKLNNVESAKVWVKEMQDQTKKALDDVWSEWNKLTTPVELAPPAAAGDAVAAAVGKEEEEFAARDKGSQRGRVFPGLKRARWASAAAIPRGRVAFAPAAAVAAAGGKRTRRRKRKKKQTRRRKYKKKKRRAQTNKKKTAAQKAETQNQAEKTTLNSYYL